MSFAGLADYQGCEKMKHVIEFDLPKDEYELRHTAKGLRYFNMIWKFEIYMDKIYQGHAEQPNFDEIHEVWREFLLDYEVQVYE